jgi:hypothetical protein
MTKNYYTYTDDKGNLYSFLQDTAIATALGNGAAGSAQPRIARSRHFFRPRKITVKLTSGGKYAQYVDGNQLFGTKNVGDAVTGFGTIVGWVDEKHSSTAAAI